MPEIPVGVQPIIALGGQLVLGIVLLMVGWQASKWGYRLTVRLFSARKLDDSLGKFLAGIVQYAILAATVIAALDTVGIQTTSLVAIFASAGLAVGLALQGSLASFASGVMILLFRPFTTGDRVTVAGQTGAVVEIGIFATTLLNYDNERIILSNSAIMSNTITNYSAMGSYRVTVTLNVAAGTDVRKAIQVLTAAAARTQGVRTDPAPDVAFNAFGPNGFELLVRGWCHPDAWLDVLHAMRINIVEDVRAAGIQIPYQQVVIHGALPTAPAKP